MEESDYEEFTKLMQFMQDIFEPGIPLPIKKVETYFEGLKDRSLEEFRLAVRRIIIKRAEEAGFEHN